MSTVRNAASALFLASLLAGCGGMFGGPAPTETDTDAVQRAEDPYHTDPKYNPYVNYNPKTQEGSESGFSMITGLFGGGKKKDNGGGGGEGGPAGVGVNSYLWRATLDTVSFMPLSSADPFGGVIITDWYSPAETPNERFKVNVFILGRELRADGVRCTVFHQRRDGSGQWAEAPVDPKTGVDIENAILTRARQMRLSTASTQ
ncbi:MAG TPA: DUF3576 domain-containing protein [Stellaceae bacterium]|jgi:hypothetical protein|nr:DUF3576 domain-containing protein [Stellaceae bacterium]